MNPAPSHSTSTQAQSLRVELKDRVEWRHNGKLHREDGPAIELASGSEVWYLNGQLHREDGPAIEGADGYNSWRLKGKLAF